MKKLIVLVSLSLLVGCSSMSERAYQAEGLSESKIIEDYGQPTSFESDPDGIHKQLTYQKKHEACMFIFANSKVISVKCAKYNKPSFLANFISGYAEYQQTHPVAYPMNCSPNGMGGMICR